MKVENQSSAKECCKLIDHSDAYFLLKPYMSA